ncbi:MAG TPA: hypothetical protein VN523_04370 [Hyphomicrobiaceae bacterium]|jgi:hypothetical protein|nr:hypothetical protein [Hyphomicrobiaceae bacterium]
MNRPRLIVAATLVAVLALLFGWQAHREQMVRACLDSGGAWTGTACGPQPPRPILQRDLRRS